MIVDPKAIPQPILDAAWDAIPDWTDPTKPEQWLPQAVAAALTALMGDEEVHVAEALPAATDVLVRPSDVLAAVLAPRTVRNVPNPATSDSPYFDGTPREDADPDTGPWVGE